MRESPIVVLLGALTALGCISAYYFPDGPPHRQIRQTNSQNSTGLRKPEPKWVHPEPKWFQSEQRQGDIPDFRSSLLTIIEMKELKDLQPDKPKPKLEAKLGQLKVDSGILQIIPKRNEGMKEKRQTSTCDISHTIENPGESVTFQSPNYPNSYPNNVKSTACFNSPDRTTMSISCDVFNVEYSRNCRYDFLGLALNGNPATIEKYCGRGILSTKQTSGNSLAAVFRSDRSNTRIIRRSPYRFSCVVKASNVSGGGSNPTSTTELPPNPGNSTCSCGKRNDQRIVGGANAKPNELPWRCYLRTNSILFFCGCSIISNTWILTAAHCTEAVMPLPNGEVLYAVVGDHDRSSLTEAVSQQIAIASIYDNPAYNSESMEGDVSLLQLSRQITYSSTISPVCLPFKYVNDDFKGTTVTASGWGKTTEGGVVSQILKEVDLPVITTEECRNFFPGQISDRMICTYSPGKDTCQGDSGGSIDLNREGRYYSIGVVSWGIGCARENNPGVYAKVPKYLDWIRSTTNETFCEP